jgi:RNA polymerase sigma-70 factor (ECF subfamily)
MTQSFFERLLAGQYLKGVAPGKGRFRSFLLVALKHFLANEWDRQHTVRRGGCCSFVSFDDAWIELCQRQDADLLAEPERSYERRWALAVLEAVKARLAAHYAASGRSRLFTALQGYLSPVEENASYPEVAARLGVSVDVIKKSVERMRRRYGEFLREEIAQTVSHPAEIDDELRHLRKVFAG